MYFCLKLQKKLPQEISLTSLSTFSPLGKDPGSIWQSYKKADPLFEKRGDWVCSLEETLNGFIDELNEEKQYRELDRSVKLAILAARGLELDAQMSPARIGINIGSSRGATALFEHYYGQFSTERKVETLASPTTTLGNISSWVAQDLAIEGIAMSHSVTCSSASNALLNGVAWIRAGMADGFIAGGSEAPLTEFTMAQMKAIKLYSSEDSTRACRSMDMDKSRNSMVLGEAAGLAMLQAGRRADALAVIDGIGFAGEQLTHAVSLSEDGLCLQRSMEQALKSANRSEVDAIVLHAPGTVKGDRAEIRAVNKVFEGRMPLLTSNKWLIGHTLGASGLMNIEMAVMMLRHQEFIPNPFFKNENSSSEPLRSIMVNAVGFGGNAVSIILGKP